MATQSETVPARRACWRWALPAIVAAALAAVVPILVLGIPEGHDIEYHLWGWIDAALQWRAGIVYPAWAQLANYGFGEPRFIFYPPLSRLIGQLALYLFPHQAVAAYVLLVLGIAGAGMFALVRQWLSPAHATLAAAFYAVSPYLLLCVYQRCALAELLASALFPLLLLFALRLSEANRAIVPLAAVFALIWLSDLPAAVVVTYALALAVAVLALLRRSPAPLVRGAAGMALGFALAAFFIVPAAYEQHWVNIAEAIGPDYRPETWEYTWTFDAEARWFYAIVSGMVYLEIALAAVAAIGSWRWRRRFPEAWYVLLALAVASSVLCLPAASRALWTNLPKLEFVEFPWRCLLVLGACSTLLLSVALARRRSHRLALVLLAVAFAGGVANGWSMYWHPGGIQALETGMRNAGGYEGGAQFMPPEANPTVLYRQRGMPLALAADASTSVRVLRWDPRQKIILTQGPLPTTLVLRLLSYPAWKASVNGHSVGTANDDTGRLTIPVPAGEGRVEVVFGRTADRTVGIMISLAAVLVVLGVLVGSRFRHGRADHATKT